MRWSDDETRFRHDSTMVSKAGPTAEKGAIHPDPYTASMAWPDAGTSSRPPHNREARRELERRYRRSGPAVIRLGRQFTDEPDVDELAAAYERREPWAVTYFGETLPRVLRAAARVRTLRRRRERATGSPRCPERARARICAPRSRRRARRAGVRRARAPGSLADSDQPGPPLGRPRAASPSSRPGNADRASPRRHGRFVAESRGDRHRLAVVGDQISPEDQSPSVTHGDSASAASSCRRRTR